uniref:Uncharacterized protein n=1 Tax=Arion vulgaris TaxID=1028688 RepID=A0A0B7BLA8_9EUPU
MRKGGLEHIVTTRKIECRQDRESGSADRALDDDDVQIHCLISPVLDTVFIG